jgi:hypothetical protein
MFRGLSRLATKVPRAGKRLEQTDSFSSTNIFTAVRNYSATPIYHGGVVTQVIGAVVDVQVRFLHR